MILAGVRAAAWALFLLLWASLSRTDYLWSKIRNRSVAWGLLGAVLAYAALAAATASGRGSYYEWGFYAAAARHAAAGWAAALLFWMLRVWPAGDAKLFALLSLLFPLLDPLSPLLPLRSVLVSLMNIFIPAAFFIVLGGFRWVWRTRVVKKAEFARALGLSRWLAYQRESLGLPALAAAAAAARARAAETLSRPAAAAWAAAEWAGFFSAAGLLTALLPPGSGSWTGLVLCAFSFFVWRALAGLLGARVLTGAFACALAAAALAGYGLPWRAAASSALHLAVFGSLMGAGMRATVSWARGGRAALWALMAAPMLLGLLGPWLKLSWPMAAFAAFLGAGLAAVHLNVSEDPCDWRAGDIGPYLVLAPSSVELIRADPAFYAEHFATRYADGLTREQAEALKAWCARRGLDRIRLERTLSFAFWIFCGFFLTAAFKRDILAMLLHV